jgi:predicted aspartyl protease
LFVGNSIQDIVVFLGFRDSNSPAELRLEGTGFLIFYEGTGYLVTARHIAEKFQETPFAIRANRHKGSAVLLDIDHAKWHFPKEAEVDLALTAIIVYAETGNGPIYFPMTRAWTH